MNFAEVLESRYFYGFTDTICFISTRSIEESYHRYTRAIEHPRIGTLFAIWLDRDRDREYPSIHAIYNYLMRNARSPACPSELDLIAVPISKKLTHLIQGDTLNGALFIHPLLAVIFATSLGVGFQIEVFAHFRGLLPPSASAMIRHSVRRASRTRSEGHGDADLILDLREMVDEKDMIIAEYKESAAAVGLAHSNTLRELGRANDEISSLRHENARLTILLSEVRNTRYRRFCDLLARITGCCANLFRCKSRCGSAEQLITHTENEREIR